VRAWFRLTRCSAHLRQRSHVRPGGNLGSQLSGGEQQMLAIRRAPMTNSHLLILGEATEGPAPLIRQEIWNCLSMLKACGRSIQSTRPRICDRHYIIERGRGV